MFLRAALVTTALSLSSCLLLMDVEKQRPEAEEIPAPSRRCAFAADDPAGPVLFFTDLESGPTTGGEDGLGAFITLYGLRFGDERGASRVTIGGRDIARYVAWNPPDTSPSTHARGLERIVIQPGPEIDASGDVVVTVGGRSSNALRFTVRAGSIYFVDPSALSDGSGERDDPFQSLASARDIAAAGDTVYLVGGTYTATDPSTFVTDHDTAFLVVPHNAAWGTPSAPIAYVAYPGTAPVLGGATSSERRTHAIWLTDPDDGDPPDNYVFAGLVLQHTSEGALPLTGPNLRIVGNVFIDALGSGALTVTDTSAVRLNARVLGNRFSDVSEALYVTTAAIGIEVGWNEIQGTHADSALDFKFGPIDGVSIHDNLLFDIEGFAILLYAGAQPAPQEGIRIYNNAIFMAAHMSALRFAMLGVPEGSPVDIANNTVRGNVLVSVADIDSATPSYSLRNNIFYGGTQSEYYGVDLNADADAVAFSNNLFFNGAPGSTPNDADAITENPLLSGVNDVPPNFVLLERSPAQDVGLDTGYCADYAGVVRPQGSAYDLGALEATR